MIVDLIAHTDVLPGAFDSHMGLDTDSEPVEDLLEFAGRTCYLSYAKKNSDTERNSDYLRNIIHQGHLSVLEHASASFYVEGVSRNMLLELERHRFLSFSVVSTRYVDAAKLKFVEPIAKGGQVRDFKADEVDDYYTMYWNQREVGKTLKQAREAAAAYLPGGTETRFVVTGNFRAWRDVLGKRLSPAANAEIRAFSENVFDLLKGLAPSAFQGLEIS